MKISIIIPVYNSIDCLERCVRSCAAQTYDDIEIILVDDGSADGTAELADLLAASDPRIKAFHKPNGGSSSARNLGIRSSAGEWLGFVDADDYIEPDMYERLISFAEKEKLSVVQVCRDELAPDGSRLPMVVTVPDEPVEVVPEDFLKELLLHKGDCSFCTKLVRRDLFDIALFPEGELNEDFRLFTDMLCSGKIDKVGILPDIGYHVCYREGSNTRKDRNEFSRVFIDIVVNADRMEEMCASSHPTLKEYARRFALVQRLDYLLHIPVKMMDRRDDFYRSVCVYLRAHRVDIRDNPYLNDDQRHKLRLLAAAPRSVRTIHSIIMKLRKGN